MITYKSQHILNIYQYTRLQTKGTCIHVNIYIYICNFKFNLTQTGINNYLNRGEP